jgi:hypothetical protein
MKVHELITKLQRCEQDAEIIVNCDAIYSDRLLVIPEKGQVILTDRTPVED